MVETEATRRLTRQAVSKWPKGLQKWWYQNRPGISGVTLYYKDLIKIIPEKACPPEYQNRGGHTVAELPATSGGQRKGQRN